MRLDTVEHCGACGGRIAEHEPLCLLAIPGKARPLLRCVTCLGPPDDAFTQRDKDIAELRQADLNAPPPERKTVRRPERVSAEWLRDWEDKNP